MVNLSSNTHLNTIYMYIPKNIFCLNNENSTINSLKIYPNVNIFLYMHFHTNLFYPGGLKSHKNGHDHSALLNQISLHFEQLAAEWILF